MTQPGTPSDSRPMVFGFVGQDRNAVNTGVSHGIGLQLQSFGFEVATINLSQAGASDTFAALAKDRTIAFAFGFQGVGARLTHPSGQNLWQMLKVPFVSLLFDHPCYMPDNHKVDSDWVINLYHCQDFLDIQKTYVRSRQMSRLMPFFVVPHNDYWLKPWKEREIPCLFLKTGNDPGELLSVWKRFPVTAQAVLHDVVAQHHSSGDTDVCGMLVKRLESEGIHLPPENDLFWTLVRNLDDYLRREHSTRLARILSDLDAVIIGDNWDHIDKTGCRARFLPAINADLAIQYFGNARFLCNTNPIGRFGTHERVPHGLMSQCVVITDDNDYGRQHFGHLPNYLGFDWRDPDLAERIRQWLETRDFAEEDLARSQAEVRQAVDSEQYFGRMLDILRFRSSVVYATRITAEG